MGLTRPIFTSYCNKISIVQWVRSYIYICPDYQGYSLNFDTEILLCRLYILELISTGEPENIPIGCCGCSLKREVPRFASVRVVKRMLALTGLLGLSKSWPSG